MAKDAENKENSLKANGLNPLLNGNVVHSIVLLPVLEPKILSEPQGANAFPVQSFPKPLQEIIKQNKECLSFPESYMGTSILFAASVAIGNTYRVVIKKGFDVPAVLYCALVGKPGGTILHVIN
jgi:hypothetical protein